MIYDTFMACAELDMLECRLTELESVPNLVHVLVEADTDHQGHPKPYHFTENADRFAPWADRLRIVQATDLPDSPDAWDREHAQREWTAEGLHDAAPDDVILHGDIDEIPTSTFVRAVQPRGVVVTGMAFHPFAVDWLHPDEWPGTVATRVRDISTFAALRDARLLSRNVIHRSGWHFSWVGGYEYTQTKLDTFCHPEIMEWSEQHFTDNDFYTHGYHVDGKRLEALTVDNTWPTYIADRRCPGDWFRPDTPRKDLTITAGKIVKMVRS